MRQKKTVNAHGSWATEAETLSVCESALSRQHRRTFDSRTQEFVLRWSSYGGNSLKEIVCQQWNFSPPGSIGEVKEYQVDLSNVTMLELLIEPNIGGGVARASLKNLRLS
jgi:hypothetical protein